VLVVCCANLRGGSWALWVVSCAVCYVAHCALCDVRGLFFMSVVLCVVCGWWEFMAVGSCGMCLVRCIICYMVRCVLYVVRFVLVVYCADCVGGSIDGCWKLWVLYCAVCRLVHYALRVVCVWCVPCVGCVGVVSCAVCYVMRVFVVYCVSCVSRGIDRRWELWIVSSAACYVVHCAWCVVGCLQCDSCMPCE